MSGAVQGRHIAGVFGYLTERGVIAVTAEVVISGWSKVGFVGVADVLAMNFNIFVTIKV